MNDLTRQPVGFKRPLLIGLWLVLLAISFPLDRPVAQWAMESGLTTAVRGDPLWHRLAVAAKFPGTYYLTLIIAAMLAAWHRRRGQAAVLMLLTAIPGLLANILKWMVGRTRPFKLEGILDQPAPFVLHPFRDGLYGLFHQSNLAFPSGHSATAFATAAALAILLPRWQAVFFVVAGVVGLERMAENAHYLSDVVAAAGISILMMQLIADMQAELIRNRA